MLLVDLQERDTCAEIWLYVNDFSIGLKEVIAGKNLYTDQSVLWKRVHHVQVAPVEAEFADTRGDAHVRFFLDEFGGGNERVSGRATQLSSHRPTSPVKIVPRT